MCLHDGCHVETHQFFGSHEAVCGKVLGFALCLTEIYEYRHCCSAGRYEVDGYVYNKNEEPQILLTGKWNASLSCQRCDLEGEPIPGTELKEVWLTALLHSISAGTGSQFGMRHSIL